MTEWIVTDDDDIQICKQAVDGCDWLWMFIEVRERWDGKRNVWWEAVHDTIDLQAYDEADVKDMLYLYGYDWNDYLESWNENPVKANQQLAEMFFEAHDNPTIERFATREDAIAYLERYTGLYLGQYKE